MNRSLLVLSLLLLPSAGWPKQPTKTEEKKHVFSSETFAGLELRGIGPALTSGRIVDIAVSSRPGTLFVAAASGGVFRSVNWGTTWEAVFEKEGSYSIGCISIDPSDPLTVWVGTGENNSQRSVGYGDGVYKSVDGGTTWQNVGLGESEHIGRIVLDPRDPNVAYVAAQGPLWRDGGQRGLFKTTDGGKTWKAVLTISDKTGVSDVWLDPRRPDVVYAASHQRRRHVWTSIQGGPESGIHKSTDGGATWKKLTQGLPKQDLGRIALAVAPGQPDLVYAMIEASDKKAAGVYRSTDAGGSWERRSDFVASSPQYFQELVPDPHDPDRLYAMDLYMRVSEDGGKTWGKVPSWNRHVDNHALWIDPANPGHLLNGNDGGLYESWDRGEHWRFQANLPITQFYRVALDDAAPFYDVYGGTQDNYTLGGPSRTRTAYGIRNADWSVVFGNDGFQPRVEPGNPDVVYAEGQYGALVRCDRKTGEKLDIQPQPGASEEPLRWNWDSPFLISPHSATRLYFGAQKLFRSDDRGASWRAVSGDLSAGVDRNQLKVMGRVWSVDAVGKNASTSFYGALVALDESPRQEGLLYAGTDDGLVQVTEDGGATWRRQDRFPGVPERAYVADLHASPHDAGTVYAAFANYKMGDFKPYLLKSADRGRSWSSIAGDLPARGSVYCVLEDPAVAGLLYAGTEFGLYFSRDGQKWVRLKGGLPTIAVRDMEVQQREGDLVVATFGRGFYVLDDLAALRGATREALEKEATLFPVRRALMYIPEEPLGVPSYQGASDFVAPNPPFGAVFTYYLEDDVQSRKQRRQAEEGKLEEKGGDVPYPSWQALEAEQREEEPAVLLTVRDDAGHVVRRLDGPVKAGFHRVAWDLRYPPADPASKEPPPEDDFYATRPIGPLAMPGRYSVSLEKRVDGKLVALGEPQAFEAEALGGASLAAPDRAALLAFQRKTARLQRAVLGAAEVVDQTRERIQQIEKALDATPGLEPSLGEELRGLLPRLRDIELALSGGSVQAKHQEPASPSIVDRVQAVVAGHWTTTSAPTETQRHMYDVAAAAFEPVLADLRRLVEADLADVERRAEAAGAPWTPGRVPVWTRE